MASVILGSEARTKVLANHLRGSLIYQEALVNLSKELGGPSCTAGGGDSR